MIDTVAVALDGHDPLVLKVMVYVPNALALTSIRPVAVFRKTSPAGVAEKVPLAPPGDVSLDICASLAERAWRIVKCRVVCGIDSNGIADRCTYTSRKGGGHSNGGYNWC